MFDHVGLKVRELRASAGFYHAALAGRCHGDGSSDAIYAGSGPADA
jgi:hypothetical protein